MTKSEAVILMYTKLLKNESFSKKEIKELINVHDLTFLRYVKDLKRFFKKYIPNKSLVYSRKNDCYYLVDTSTLPQKEVKKTSEVSKVN